MYSKSRISSGSTNRDKIKSPTPTPASEGSHLITQKPNSSLQGKRPHAPALDEGERQRMAARHVLAKAGLLHLRTIKKAFLNPFQSGPMAERLTEKAHIKKKKKSNRKTWPWDVFL